jgi:hypothetical protein
MMRSAPDLLRACAWLAPALLLAVAPVHAQRVQSAVVPDGITVGDVFRAAIRVELDDDVQVVAPDSLSLGADLESAGRREVRIDTAGGVRRVTFVYPLAAWRPGSYTLPDATLQVVRDGSVESLVARLPAFEVRSVLPADTAGIQPQPAKDVLGANRVWWPLLLGLALLLLAAALLYAWWRRRRRPREAAPAAAVPAVPPREAALARLEQLRRSGLLERGELRPYYETLTETLRRYAASVEPAWGTDLTTSELAQRLRAADRLQLTDALELTRVLGAADLVKFARATPPSEAAAHDLAGARAWIERVPPPAAEIEADTPDERQVA